MKCAHLWTSNPTYNRASILYQSDEMFSRLELDCRYKAQLTGHPIGPPIECQSCANPVRSVQRTAHAVHCTPRNRATILLRLLPIAVSVSIRSQSCYNLGRLRLDCIISVRNPATIVHQSCTNLVCTAHRAGGRVSGFFVEIPSAFNRASILYQSDKMFSRLELDCKQKLITIGK